MFLFFRIDCLNSSEAKINVIVICLPVINEFIIIFVETKWVIYLPSQCGVEVVVVK
jgi:hypothetical protein